MEITVYVRFDDACDAAYWELGLCSHMCCRCDTCDNEMITFGYIVAFMMYIRSVHSTTFPISASDKPFQSAVAASERVFEFLAEKN